ncbi:MAG: hypothetical protein JNK87_24180 [Bryobacterales bacterium]|nr:hypothetical protein [Bryobacterales bacterium]
MILLNAVLVSLGAAKVQLGAGSPGWLREPWPLDPLAVAGLVGSILLVPRLYPMHPLKALVQKIAVYLLTGWMLVTVPMVIYLVRSQMEVERNVILAMAGALDKAAEELQKAATFPYKSDSEIRAYLESPSRADAAMVGLQKNPALLALPDARRWEAARILEQEGQLEPGRLASAARNFMDALHAALTTEQIPVLRTGRYVLNENMEYVRNDAYYRKQPKAPKFSPGAEIATKFFGRLHRWLKHSELLATGPESEYYAQRVAAIADTQKQAFSEGVTTRWWGQMLRASTRPEFSELLETPLYQNGTAMGRLDFWRTSTWDAFSKTSLAVQGPCRIMNGPGPRVELAPAADEALDDRQRTDGRTYLVPVKFDRAKTVQCFGYLPAERAADSPLVVELKATYSVTGRPILNGRPCPAGRCPTVWGLPEDAPVTELALVVHVPPSHDANKLGQEVVKAISASAGRLESALGKELRAEVRTYGSRSTDSSSRQYIYVSLR